MPKPYVSVEICAGAGGQALGLELAGFRHVACVENDSAAVSTLRLNRDSLWNIVEEDVRNWSLPPGKRVDLLAGGIPCPPYSVAGQQLGANDDRDLFPEVMRLTREIRPRAVLVENVKGLLGSKFAEYRLRLLQEFLDAGYVGEWKLLNASDFGVPQLRPRAILVGLQAVDLEHFAWPQPQPAKSLTVGKVLLESMGSAGWEGAFEWAQGADSIAPTLVGGSKKHGGADLGPTRSKQAWAALNVNGHGVGDAVPSPGFTGAPKLTVLQAALLQGFPPDWQFAGRKTAVYRQVGNAFPPPVAAAVGRQIIRAFRAADRAQRMTNRVDAVA